MTVASGRPSPLLFLFLLFPTPQLAILVCPNRAPPFRSLPSLEYCSAFIDSLACCSFDDEQSLRAQLDALINVTLYPRCYNLTRDTNCGVLCSQYAGYFRAKAGGGGGGGGSGGGGAASFECASSCVVRRRACVDEGYNVSLWAPCDESPTTNCYGNGEIPDAAKDQGDGLGDFSPTKLGGLGSGAMIGVMVGMIVLVCACLFCCAYRQIKSSQPRQKREKVLQPSLQARLERARNGGGPGAFRSPTFASHTAKSSSSSSSASSSHRSAWGRGANVTAVVPVGGSSVGNSPDEEEEEDDDLFRPGGLDDETVSALRGLCLSCGACFCVPAIITCFLPFGDVFLSAYTLNDWYGRITKLQPTAYVLCLSCLFVVWLGWAAGKAILRGTTYSLIPVYAFVVMMSVGWSAVGFFGYLAVDESFGRVYAITASDPNSAPTTGSGSIVTFVLIVVLSCSMILPTHAALRLLAIPYPRLDATAVPMAGNGNANGNGNASATSSVE